MLCKPYLFEPIRCHSSLPRSGSLNLLAIDFLSQQPQLHGHVAISVVFDDIPFFHSAIQVAPLPCIHCPLLSLPPLPIRPPAGQNSILHLCHVQEILKVDQWVVFVVESASIARKSVIVLNTHAIAVNQLAESVFLGELVQVVFGADTFKEVAGNLGHGIKIGCDLGFVVCVALLRRATKFLVGFPIGFLAVTAAVPLILAFGAAFEG